LRAVLGLREEGGAKSLIVGYGCESGTSSLADFGEKRVRLVDG